MREKSGSGRACASHAGDGAPPSLFWIREMIPARRRNRRARARAIPRLLADAREMMSPSSGSVTESELKVNEIGSDNAAGAHDAENEQRSQSHLACESEVRP